jgi:proline iminopeptidase
MAVMKAAFRAQGKAGILKARAIEERLMHDTWEVPGYDLVPRLQGLRIPTLVIAGEDDFIPVEIAHHIAAAIPRAQLVTIKGCGHFAYLERPDDVHNALTRFFAR